MATSLDLWKVDSGIDSLNSAAKSMRTIAMRIPTRRVLEGGGFEVRRPAAMGAEMSPFLLLDEMGPTEWGPGEAIGAPSHPHRGFETVTYLLKGKMEHKDSAGNSGSLREGDVQWMTAGSGVIHSELPEPEFKRKGGLMHGFQIWVNLPAKDKMMAPRYQDIPASDIPVAESEDGGVKVVVVAGESMGVDAIIDTVIPITYLDVTLKDGELKQDLASELNAMVYIFEGTLNIAGEKVEDGGFVILSDGDAVELSGTGRCLVLAGPAIDEPIARYGPFVMNTQEDIMQAIDDYQRGRLVQ